MRRGEGGGGGEGGGEARAVSVIGVLVGMSVAEFVHFLLVIQTSPGGYIPF